MRPIDADALKLYIDKEVEEDKVLDGWAFFFKVYLDDASTIDIDRPKGEWNHTHKFPNYECSECGECEVIASNFCPNCGADMRERGASE